MIMPVAALPPAAVDGESWFPALMMSAGCPILTYAPMNQRHSEQAIEERIVGCRRPHMSIKKT